MSGNKLLIVTGVFTILFGIFSAFPAIAQPSNPLDAACDELSPTDVSAACIDTANQGENDPIAGPDGIIRTTANLVALVAGIAAVVYIIFGAFAFITAGGDQQKVATARTRVFNGVIGLVVVALAWAIVGIVTKFILQT